MKRANSKISFFEGAAVALALALVASLGIAGLTFVLGAWPAAKLLAVFIFTVYATYLIKRSGNRTGRLFTACVWLIVMSVLVVTPVSVVAVCLILLGMLWLVRATHYRSGLLDSVSDMALTVGGAIAALGALLITGTIFFTVWTFFLVQALHPFISTLRLSKGRRRGADNQRFTQAFNHAEAALRRIHQTHV